MQASQRKPARGPLIVPLDAVAALAVASAKQSDAIIALVMTVGSIAERLEDPRIIEWLTPFIINVTAYLDDIQAVLKAILEENADGRS